MADRSSRRPHRSTNHTPPRTERHHQGPGKPSLGTSAHRLLLGLKVSTVHNVLTRYGLAKLRWLNRATGRVVRRIETTACGELVHVDGKMLAGGGWRMLGRTKGNHNSNADPSSGRRSKHGDPLR